MLFLSSQHKFDSVKKDVLPIIWSSFKKTLSLLIAVGISLWASITSAKPSFISIVSWELKDV